MRNIVISVLALALAGCVTTVQNTPNPTATEQLLVAHSAERAAAGLNLHLPVGSKVYLDTGFGNQAAKSSSSSTTTSSQTAQDRYVVEAVQAHLIGHGAVLVDSPENADIVVRLRISADSLDDLNRVLGFPAMTVPSFESGVPAVNVPELSIWSEHQRSGIVELSAVATDAHTGKLIAAAGPVFATARIVNRHLLTGFMMGNELERPGIRADTK